MSNISIRLPEELEARLDREARLAGKKRSELAREAIASHLKRLERARFVGDMAREARALYSDRAGQDEDRDAAGEGLEEWLESIEVEERDAGIDPDEQWWE
ncbi:MAG: CopG family transcriptional regulator [Arenicellales bacterium]|jgi:predicted DNA-binding protein